MTRNTNKQASQPANQLFSRGRPKYTDEICLQGLLSSKSQVLTKKIIEFYQKNKNKKKKTKQIIRHLQIFCVVEVFYQVLITVKVCDIYLKDDPPQPAAKAKIRRKKNDV